ncbi:MAG: hypothetical protein ABFD50_21535 [Smithella sp.]
MLTSENKKWLADFKTKYGRPPCILHIGNIANNAYNNAKLLNEAGLDCDVICYDYYHIMGCPEWEDADFEGEIADQFKPDWTKVNLNGFERPPWFAQGKLVNCINYLIARKLCKSKTEVNRLWCGLKIDNKAELCAAKLSISFLNFLGKQADRLHRLNYASRLRTSLLEPLLLRTNKYNHKIALAGDLISISIFFLLLPLFIIFRYSAKKFINSNDFDIIDYNFEKNVNYICNIADCIFKDSDYKLSAASINEFKYIITSWHNLFLNYDLILAYSTDAILPLLADKRPYCAFEHGTLRSIPFEESSEGRMCAASYNQADHIFVTNFDCLPNAERLAPGRFTLLNHPYDEDQPEQVASDWMVLRETLMQDLQADLLLFHPTRHDWVEGTGYADKGNDLLLNTFIKLILQKGFRLGMVCCEWGNNVEQSKMLFKKYKVANHVKWVKPLGIVGYTRMCKASHIVADQFKLGAFGGITFKALAAGAPVMIFIDIDKILQQYPEVPPVINCSTEQDILDELCYWYNNIDRLADRGALGRAWMKKYHNKSHTINSQINVFKKLINIQGSNKNAE